MSTQTLFVESGNSPPMVPTSSLQISTPCLRIFPENIRVLPVPMNVIVQYQKAMACCKWKPAWGHKLGFLVVHGDALLGILALVSPVIRLTARDEYLFPEAKLGPAFTGDPQFHFNKKGELVFDYGSALRSYMDMSVCVAAQPIGWHWNIGKLLAMIATTLGDFVEERYPDDKFAGSHHDFGVRRRNRDSQNSIQRRLYIPWRNERLWD